jgi:hypothetical protein
MQQMTASESFDAFYARTAWSVTSQMHALAGDDSAADHAIREAYARAYQEWYQVSGSPDPEGWVFAAAKEAYQRRRLGAGVTGRDAGGGPGSDAGTWPGIYRPRAGQEPGAGGAAGFDAFAPAAAPDYGQAGSPAFAGGILGSRSFTGGDEEPGSGGVPGGAMATARVPGRSAADPRSPQRGRPGQAANRRTITAVLAAIAVLAACGIAYLAVGHHKASSAASPTAPGKPPGKPAPHMLPAGRVGSPGGIPWSLIGPGWTLVEFSTSPPNANGQASGDGIISTFLVDPEGGRYLIRTWQGSVPPALLAWSGDGHQALLATGGGATGAGPISYSLVALATGQVRQLQLPAGVNAVGFTRPDGLNILAVRTGPVGYKLQRYDLFGSYQATIADMPRKPGQPAWDFTSCGPDCGALSSPDGDTAVWGIAGDEMQLVSNAGGLTRRLHVPGSGTPSSCAPISWWNSYEVLANCAAAGAQAGATRLWLVPADGAAATQLTGPAGTPSGNGYVNGAWPLGGQVYVTVTSSAQCQAAASGPGGLGILRLGQGGSTTPIAIPDSTNNHSTVLAGVGGRLLILAQTSCPGTSSLLWLNPSTGATQTLLTGPATEVGVIAAVPYGDGPTATTAGW